MGHLCQARGETITCDYTIEDASADKPQGEMSCTYSLKPELPMFITRRSPLPTRVGPTSLVRVEGTDMRSKERLRYLLA